MVSDALNIIIVYDLAGMFHIPPKQELAFCSNAMLSSPQITKVSKTFLKEVPKNTIQSHDSLIFVETNAKVVVLGSRDVDTNFLELFK